MPVDLSPSATRPEARPETLAEWMQAPGIIAKRAGGVLPVVRPELPPAKLP